MIWSKYQEAVFASLENNTNLFVDAVAGSGKSTVIKESVARIPQSKTVLLVAFNRHIRDPLKEHFAGWPNVTVHTLNSFGNSIIRENGWAKVDVDKTANILFFEIFQGKATPDADKKFYYSIRHSVSKVISLLKANMKFHPTDDEIIGMAMDYNIRLPDEIYRWLECVKKTYGIGWTQLKKIDYDDQIAFPIYHELFVPVFDYVFVDESQDLSPFQIELTARAGNISSGGLYDNDEPFVTTDAKMVYVGDPRQAIYQFRGADKHAVASITRMLNCTTLPLSVCYRCSKAVVAEAQKIVSHIEACETAEEGSVQWIERCDLRGIIADGDYILCRTTAPLVSECLGLIAAGRKAQVKGRDFAETLKDMLPKDTGMGVLEAIEAIETEYQPKIAKLQSVGAADKAILISDSIDCVKSLAVDCKTVFDIAKMIDKIFVENAGPGINLMTVHKAKGLETTTVFILRPELMPHPKATDAEAELNIQYVAETRAKRNLYWVQEPEKVK